MATARHTLPAVDFDRKRTGIRERVATAMRRRQRRRNTTDFLSEAEYLVYRSRR